MLEYDSKIMSNNDDIHILDKKTISLIAAGEVVLRPLDAVKELIENSIDSGAKKIEINLESSGKNSIEVIDNGCGISKDGLEKCLLRHATSKIQDSDITNLMYMGFRGEGLYAISSVSRVVIESSRNGESHRLSAEEGKNIVFSNSNINVGTRVYVKNLFFNTPIKLKFLKSDIAELNDIKNLIIAYSLIHNNISFSLDNNNKRILFFSASDFESRIISIKGLGTDFLDNSFRFEKNSNNYSVYGYASLPNASFANMGDKNHVYIYINNRIIKDDMINMAIRTAYKDFLLSVKKYKIILAIKTDFINVDVNIHPNKMKVRFLYEREIISLIIAAIKYGLVSNGQDIASNVSTRLSNNLFPDNSDQFNSNKKADNISNTFSFNDAKFLPEYNIKIKNENDRSYLNNDHNINNDVKKIQAHELYTKGTSSNVSAIYLPNNLLNEDSVISKKLLDCKYENNNEDDIKHTSSRKKDFGVPICQLYNTYIISQNYEGFYLIDQHAVHERILYEKYKNILTTCNQNIGQKLLISEAIILPKHEILSFLLDNADHLIQIGFSISVKSEEDLMIEVVSIPAFLKNVDILEVIHSLYEAFFDDSLHLNNKFERFYADYACKKAIKAGEKLQFEEMVELIKQMEMCERVAQCNHGRATYTFLSKKKLDSFFDRV